MNTVLFDLDGTLLPMDQDLFVEAYLREISLKGAALGYGASQLVGIVLAGFEAMVANNGSVTNEEVFWTLFLETFGGDLSKHRRSFEEFYRQEFQNVAAVVKPTPLARQYVQILKRKGYRLVLATNPVFPRLATFERMRWAGLDPADFELITTYENSRYAKPNLDYYQDILGAVQAKPEKCLMVGNDVLEDLSAAQLGLEVFLVTDDLINTPGVNLAPFRQGSRQELLHFFKQLPPVS